MHDAKSTNIRVSPDHQLLIRTHKGAKIPHDNFFLSHIFILVFISSPSYCDYYTDWGGYFDRHCVAGK